MSELVERLRETVRVDPLMAKPPPRVDLYRLMEEAADALALRDDKIAALRRAVDDEGPVPEHHRRVMARHRREWPTLWDAIEGLIR